jgi:hypothetical protein
MGKKYIRNRFVLTYEEAANRKVRFDFSRRVPHFKRNSKESRVWMEIKSTL